MNAFGRLLCDEFLSRFLFFLVSKEFDDWLGFYAECKREAAIVVDEFWRHQNNEVSRFVRAANALKREENASNNFNVE